ncbi:MAG: rod shape-determining protein RodA [Lentisphaeria bacterium]|nr:rod shape-determining protein RodA [Lentisphaerota bacterium]MBR7144616.1 rod shape-determining protein RodA [Lentisphaeria bacterium]
MRRGFFKNQPDTPSVNLKPLAKEFAGWDILQLIVMLLLLSAGVLFIYTTGEQIGSQLSRSFWKKQLAWIFIGFIAYIAAARCDYRKLIPWVWFYYLFSVAMLILVLFVGVKVNGATSWIDLKFMRLQPSEFAKLGVIWFLAAMHGNMLFKISKLPHILLSLAALGVPVVLIAIEPDFGSAAVLAPVGAVMVFTAGINWKYLAIAGAAMVLIAGALTANELLEIRPLLKNYQRERIKTFLNPERDLAHRGYNAYQSRLAVGSGGMWGKGLGQGTQNPLGFLPRKVSNNDFIFSVIAEETGFAGAVTLITAYILLLYTVLRSAFFAADSFARQSGIGIAMLIFVHLFINIGMSIGVTPITGLPLPFLSYGGSFVVSMMLALGFMQSVYRRNVLSQEEDREFRS